MRDHFGVGVGIEAMTASLQARSQFWKVVDLPIEHDPNRFIFVVDWLMSACQINDAQPTHAEANVGLHIHAFVVRAAMHNALAHPVNDRFIRGRARFRIQDAGDTAHCLMLRSTREARDLRRGLRGHRTANWKETEVPVISRISDLPITSRANYVDHLPGSSEVDLILPASRSSLY